MTAPLARIRGGAIDIRAKTGCAQSRSRICAREECCGSRFLDRNVETKNRRVLLAEDAEDHTRSVDDRDCDARITAEWLPDRCARDVCLLRGVRDYRGNVTRRQCIARWSGAGDERKEPWTNFALNTTDDLRHKL